MLKYYFTFLRNDYDPLVNLQQYANTLTKMIEMAGFKDATTFINTTVPPMPPQPQEPAKPSPEEMLAQAEAMKALNYGARKTQMRLQVFIHTPCSSSSL